MPITQREPALVVQDIIQSELALKDGQVMFTNQKYFIPTNGLYIVVSYLGPSKVISTVNEWADDGAGGLTEIQSLNVNHTVQIQMMSFDDTARIRKEEIHMAIHSIYSQQQQELYSMWISPHPGPMLDISYLEETKMLTRYVTTLTVLSVYSKQKAVDSYTDFSRAVPPRLTVNA